MSQSYFTRRQLLLAPAAAALACGRQKATGYPGYAFVANQEGRTVSAVDLTRFRVWKQIALDAPPTAIIALNAHKRVLALAPSTGTVFEIDGPTLSVTRRIRAGAVALGFRLSAARDAVWVVYRDPAEAVEFPLDTLTPRRRIRFSAAPDDFDFSREGTAAFAFQGSRSISLATLASSRIDRTFQTAVESSIVRFQSDAKQLLTGSRADRSITIYDSASGRTVVRLPLPIAPRNFCFTRDGGQLFVSGDGSDGLVIVYPYDSEVAETILAGHAPTAMAVTDAPSYLLVANPESNSVTVLDVETRKLLAVVNVGGRPANITITPDHQYALVLNQQSGDLAVIRIPALAARRYKSAPLFTMIPVGAGPVAADVLEMA